MIKFLKFLKKGFWRMVITMICFIGVYYSIKDMKYYAYEDGFMAGETRGLASGISHGLKEGKEIGASKEFQKGYTKGVVAGNATGELKGSRELLDHFKLHLKLENEIFVMVARDSANGCDD